MNANTARSLPQRDEYAIDQDFGESFAKIEELTKDDHTRKSRSLQFATKRALQSVADYRRAGMVPEDWAKHIISVIEKDTEGEVSRQLLQERDTLKALLKELH